MEIIYLLIGLGAGFSIGVFYTKSKTTKQGETLDLSSYVSKVLYESEKQRLLKEEVENKVKEEQIGNLKADVSSKNTLIETLQIKLAEEGIRLEAQQKQLQTQFENMANAILEKKSEKFAEQNQKNIDQILKPLGEKIKSFEESVQDKYVKDQEGRAGLEKQITMLQAANHKISQDAINLTKALKPDFSNKTSNCNSPQSP